MAGLGFVKMLLPVALLLTPLRVTHALAGEEEQLLLQEELTQQRRRAEDAEAKLAALKAASSAPATAPAAAPASAPAAPPDLKPDEIVLIPEKLTASQQLTIGPYIKDLQKSREGLDAVRKLVETPDADGSFKAAKDALRSLPVAYVATSCINTIELLNQLGLKNLVRIKSAQAEMIKLRLEKLDNACEPVKDRPDLQLLITDIQKYMDVFTEGLSLKKVA
mmetsp:Transcript_22708/g.38827  ORF Transcript_22708/g.38827 Transcript_22708/m.38827 type:complete len:221 (+) Transcript_22708:163-825(+)